MAPKVDPLVSGARKIRAFVNALDDMARLALKLDMPVAAIHLKIAHDELKGFAKNLDDASLKKQMAQAAEGKMFKGYRPPQPSPLAQMKAEHARQELLRGVRKEEARRGGAFIPPID